MRKLMGRLVLSMLMVFLFTRGTTAISVLGNSFHLEKWITCHDEKGPINIGDHVGIGTGGKNFTMEYLGLCIRDNMHRIIPKNLGKGVSIPDDLTQCWSMQYEGDIQKESVSHMPESAPLILMGTGPIGLADNSPKGFFQRTR